MAYNLTPFITSLILKSACREWLYGIYNNENMIAKANKNRLVVLRKTSSVSSYKVWGTD